MASLVVGCGYLGAPVARSWLAAGKEVYALSRTGGARLPSGVVPILGDVTDPASLGKLRDHPWECVLYAVGMDRRAGKSFREVYVDGLKQVLEALPAGGRFIYISSTSVYGQADGSWVDERSPTEPAEENGRIVLEAERLLHRLRPEAMILRFAGLYGPGRLLRRAAIEKGELLASDPDGWLNLIHVQDGARAVLAAEQYGRAGEIYTVSDGSPVKRGDFYGYLGNLLNAPPVRFVPPLEGEGANRRIDNAKAKRDLNWEPTFADYTMGLKASLD